MSDHLDPFEATRDSLGLDPLSPTGPSERSPFGLVVSAHAANFGSLVCLLLGSEVFNWVGYVLGGVVVAFLVVRFWTVDYRRRRSPNYVSAKYPRVLAGAALLIGIALAGQHGLSLAQSQVPI